MLKFGRTFVDGGFRPVVAKEGPKWTQVVLHDGGRVRVKRVRGKLDYSPMYGPRGEYTLSKVARAFLRRNKHGIRFAITKGARKILTEATKH
jgi:hypothetical protein